MAEAKVFAKVPVRKCLICKDKEMSDWLRDCVIATVKAGEPRPPSALVQKEMRIAFGDRAPATAGSTRRHLREHEPAWREFDEEDS